MDAVTAPDFHAETDVDASPAAVWAAVGDPARMARWSPEGVVVKVFGPPRVGSRTLNINRRGLIHWPTSSTIVRYEIEREIAWSVRSSGTVWSLELAPGATPGTTRLVHRRVLAGAKRPLVARMFAPVLGGIDGHDVELDAGMRRTLTAIKTDVENPS